MNLVPNPPGRIAGGEIIFQGENVLKKSKHELRKMRGREVSMIFQDPMTSLNGIWDRRFFYVIACPVIGLIGLLLDTRDMRYFI